MDEGRPISYEALRAGTPVLTAGGTEFGKVHHVLQVPELDVFDGLSVKTPHGLRFVDRDQIAEITTTLVRCTLSDEEAAALPAPSGPPVRPAALEEPRRIAGSRRLQRSYRCSSSSRRSLS